jgi:hypothetical protein
MRTRGIIGLGGVWTGGVIEVGRSGSIVYLTAEGKGMLQFRYSIYA